MVTNFVGLFLGRFLASVLLIVIGYFFYKFLCLLVDRLIHRIDPDAPHGLATFDHRVFSLSGFLKHLIGFFTLFFLAFFVLTQFNVNATSLALLSGLVISGILFGLQDLIKDLVRGFFIYFENQYQVGDEVIINQISGTVEKMNLRSTFLNGKRGEQIIVPHHLIKEVYNLSKSPIKVALEVGFGRQVVFEKILEVLEKILEDFYQKSTANLEDRPKMSFFEKFNEEFYSLKIEFRCPAKVRHELASSFKKTLAETFEKENIDFVFYPL